MNSSQMLNKIQELAPDFDAFGSFVSDEHFLACFNYYILATTESEQLIETFKEKVLSSIKNKRSLMDVGPGSYRMIDELGGEFSHIAVVDTNSEILSLADSNRVCADKKVAKYHCSITEVDLTSDSYDFVLLVHVLYYIDRSSWMDVTNKLYASLTEGGKLVVSLGGENSSKEHLLRYFSVKTLDIQSYTQDCVSSFGASNVTIHSSIDTTTTNSLEPMLHCAGFLLGDCQGEAKRVTRKELSEYLDMHSKREDGNYEIASKITSIVITKTA